MMKIAYLGSGVGFKALEDVLAGRAVAEHVETSSKALETALKSASGLLDASMKVRITNEMIRGAPHLKIIACATTGSDHIEREELEQRNTPVRTLREDRDLLLGLTPAAELSWALLMACARRLPAAHDHVKAGQWNRDLFPGIMLKGRRLGIIGCGRIGTWMARYAKAFGMELAGYDPYVNPLPEGIASLSLEDLVKTSDFLSVHVHLSEETRSLLSRDLLESAKPGIIVVNTSRGAVIDEEALLDGLKSGRIGGAGMDVLEGEPDIDSHPLVRFAREHDNVVITPHCGGNSPDAVALVCRRTAEKIVEALELHHEGYEGNREI